MGGTMSAAWCINDSGQAVGYYGHGDGGNYDRIAFLYQNGVVTNLNEPGSPDAFAWGINNAGQVCGEFNGTAGIWYNGSVTNIGSLIDGGSSAQAINNNGQVAGWYFDSEGRYHGFLYGAGEVTDLGSLGGGDVQAFAINDSAQVVGLSGGHAFLYSNGVMVDLGTLPNDPYSCAYGINNKGQIVGATGGSAFLYENGVMTDLSTFLTPENSGWLFWSAYDINDDGWITGVARRGDLGEYHAFILTPEPGTIVLLALGGAVVRRCRRL